MPKRLLLVDSDQLHLNLLEQWLSPLGCQTTRVLSGQETIACFDEQGADMVLMDPRTADGNGLEVIRHIKEKAPYRYVPIVVMSAVPDPTLRLRVLKEGADEFLEKPIDQAILLARISTLFRLQDTADELGSKNRELEQLQHLQRDLTDFVVHDLKSPLSVVQVNLSWIRERLSETDSELLAGLQDAEEGLRKLRDMVQDLLSISRLEASPVPLVRKRIAISSMIGDVVRMHMRYARAKNVTLSVITQEGITVEGDPQLLQRVLENVVENSLRHTPSSGKLALSTRKAEGVEICVSNTGHRLSAEDREHVFDKFARSVEKRSHYGNVGLGLYFCKRVVEAHGGTIEVMETSEWPTTFLIKLPTPTKLRI